jgi:hypothetical protein
MAGLGRDWTQHKDHLLADIDGCFIKGAIGLDDV